MRARVGTTLSYGWFLTMKGELDAAETVLEEVRTTAAELGIEPSVAAALMKLGCIARLRGDHKLAEKRLREAMRMISARGDRGMLPDYQAVLAATLADLGKIDEAERLALESRTTPARTTRRAGSRRPPRSRQSVRPRAVTGRPRSSLARRSRSRWVAALRPGRSSRSSG